MVSIVAFFGQETVKKSGFQDECANSGLFLVFRKRMHQHTLRPEELLLAGRGL
jgi:hypothetical protein